MEAVRLVVLALAHGGVEVARKPLQGMVPGAYSRRLAQHGKEINGLVAAIRRLAAWLLMAKRKGKQKKVTYCFVPGCYEKAVMDRHPGRRVHHR